MRAGTILLYAVTVLSLNAQAQKKAPVHGHGTFSRPEVKEELSTVASCLGRGEIDTSKLTKNEISLLDEIVAGRDPRFSDVTAAWLSAEVRRYNTLRETKLTDVQVQDLLRAATVNSRPGVWAGMKNQVTDRAVARLKLSEFYYNEAFTSPLDVILAGKSQAKGFTSFLHLAARFSWGEEPYRKLRPVVVFTQGHALPAILTKEAEKDLLMGIETTVAGAGSRPFGNVAALAKVPEPVRLVDGEMFALLEMLGDRLPEKVRSCWAEAALRDSAARYGFDRDAIEKRIAKSVPTVAVVSGSIESRLAFGTVYVLSGDRRRVKVDTIEASTSIAPLSTLAPSEVAQEPALVVTPKTVDAMAALIRADSSDAPLKRMSLADLKTELATMEKKSIAQWRVNKESRNEEVGTSSAVLNGTGLSSETVRVLGVYLSERTDSGTPEAARKASAEVFLAKQSIQKLAGARLQKWTPVQKDSLYDAVAFAGRTQAVKAKPEDRKDVLETAIDAALSEAHIPEEDRKAMLPSMVDLELRRFDSDTAWRRVFFPGLPESLPATPPKKW